MENKYLWLIGGLLIGYYVAQKRIGKKTIKAAKYEIQEAVDKTTRDVTNEIEVAFDQMLQQAKEKGLSVEQVQQFLKQA